MQNTPNNPLFNDRYREKLFTALRLIILAAVVWFVVQALQQHRTGLLDIWQYAQASLTTGGICLLLLVLALTLLNWSLEALKWQALAAKIQPIHFREAFRGVLAGLSLNFATPASLGDYAGRIWNLKGDRRLENLGAIVLGNGVQFYVSLLGGTLAYGYFLGNVLPDSTAGHWVLLALLLAALVGGVWIAGRREAVPALFNRFSWLRPYGRFFRVMAQYSPREMARILGWATLRYAVFTVQFLLVLDIFGIPLPMADRLCVVSLVFFAKTAIPAFHFLSDLGVREFTALYFFGFYNVAPEAVVSATLTLWFVNILLPVGVGTVWLLRMRFGPAPVAQPITSE
ncbi:MAG: flippase-like domain-containing protein [Cytophagaceae bacterium]|nr:flippase-like domain-containing protein [Cytophagaceae bacterium]